MADHAFVTFRGVNAHLDVQFTLAHGIAPSQCQIRVPPTNGIEEGGTLVLIFGGTRIEFPDCKVGNVDVARNADGLEVWTLTIFDRRWKWKECGGVSGYYNVREGDNASNEAGIPKQVRKGTEKHIRDLMKLCLEAMGETGFNLSKVPTDLYPETEWDYENPASALAKLADIIKFRIVLTLRNRVELWPDGEGQKLTTQQAMEYQITVDPPERPDRLIFVGARILYETDLELEAVCRSVSGEYLPINHPAISYKPEQPIEGNHWALFDSEFGNATFDTPISTINGVKTLRDLAKADVYRKYRIKEPFSTAATGFVAKRELILPLLSSRLRTESQGGVMKVKPPVIWGVYTRDEAAPDFFKEIANPDEKLDKDGNPPQELSLTDGFQIDEKTGIVTFDRPRKRLTEAERDVDGQKIATSISMPAQLFLRIGFGLRDAKTRAWKHYEIPRDSNGRRFGTKPRYIKADDAIHRRIDTKTGVDSNLPEYAKMAKFYLDAEEQRFATRDPCAATYPGLRPVNPDGAIQQVTWSITESGATTRVSRNREEAVLGLTYAEQRFYQQIRTRLDNAAATSREADDRNKRKPA